MATTELDKTTVEKYIEACLYSDMDRFLSEVMRAFESRLKDCVRKVCSDLEAKVFRQEASDKIAQFIRDYEAKNPYIEDLDQ